MSAEAIDDNPDPLYGQQQVSRCTKETMNSHKIQILDSNEDTNIL